MKKMMVAVATAALCMGMLLAGCTTLDPGQMGGIGGEGEKTPLEQVTEKYERLPDAKTIGQKITIAAGDLVRYESEKTISKSGEGYSMTGTVKKLNPIGTESEEPYTVEEVEETYTAAKFTVTLDLKELYFTGTPTYEKDVFKCSVKDEAVGNVFSIAEEFPEAATPKGMTIEITTSGEHIAKIAVAYLSTDERSGQTSNVTITLTFAY